MRVLAFIQDLSIAAGVVASLTWYGYDGARWLRRQIRRVRS